MSGTAARFHMKKRAALILAVIASLALVGAVLLHTHLRLGGLEEEVLHLTGVRSAGTDGEKTLTVKLQPISRNITLTGHIGPGHIENIPAPFSGTVKKISFNYDASVAKEEVLLELDSGEIQSQLWEAESAYLLAQQNYEKLLDWENGTEVQSARRQLDAARDTLTDAQRKAHETKMLYGKGIVSGDEYQSSIEALHNGQRSLQTAKASLQATLDKGSGQNVKRVKLQRDSARAKRDRLRNKIAESVVKAPFEGVVVTPYDADGGGSGGASQTQPKRLALGSKVNGGEPLLGIADLRTYLVAAKVDEIEVNKLQLGQQVTVTGEAFPGITLKGRVSRIAQEAAVSQGSAGLANFKVWVEIPELMEAQRRQLRIGMTAHMEIVTYSNDNAIVLPLSAMHGDPGESWVLRQPKDGAEPQRVVVTTGITTLDGVEVLSGLDAGDRVIVAGEHP